MRSLRDTTHALDSGLAAIREQYAVPSRFPAGVLAAAHDAARRAPSEHVDRTDWPFVTLDPASSTDLDQAFTIERSGSDLVLHYAIADVGWFVDDGGAIDAEAWARGTTVYLPDARAPLHPPELSEAAASLLPDGPRPAVVFHVRLDDRGRPTLDGAERSIIRSRAKLGYATVTPEQLPEAFAEFARRAHEAEVERGASVVEPPEQLVHREGRGYALTFRPRLWSEAQNAAMSLSTNIAVAEALVAAKTGLFRVMAAPDERAERRLRHTAAAFGVEWPETVALDAFTRSLDQNDPANAAFLLAVRRAGGGATYAPYTEGVVPWHAAIAATYTHATAPLRRLADRYVVQAALAVASGLPVPEHVLAALPKLPDAMARTASRASAIDRAVLDLAEAVMLEGREGEEFTAVVVQTDNDACRIQIAEPAVVAHVGADGLRPGDHCTVRLVAADVASRTVRFELA